MAKKVKCIECINVMEWALPDEVIQENVDYAKRCLSISEKTFVCGQTMKTKNRSHEQYCKHFEKDENNAQYYYEKQRSNLAEKIARYEECKAN